MPTLDFFATLWMMIEYPGKALKRIVIAEHKNYVLMLAMFFGISVGFGLFWAVHAGNRYDNIAYLIIAASGAGLILALPLFYALTGVLHALAVLLGGKGPWRSTYAVAGWALFPFTFATVIVLPVELAAFGLLFFSDNPHPFEVKPLVYGVLIGIDALMALWSVWIGVKGLALAHSIRTWKSFIVVVLVVTAGTFLLYGAARWLLVAP
ncbi:MAG TPA: Yip1 family protein [Bacteroidota bacterium]|nr:Yip1 family protein [Bacteroidota bacterium]